MIDLRHEERNQEARLPSEPGYESRTVVQDTRKVSLVIEPGETEFGLIPEVLDDQFDRTLVNGFFVKYVRFSWVRSGPYNEETERWGLGKIGYNAGVVAVSGINRKADGSLGMKTGVAHYPKTNYRVVRGSYEQVVTPIPAWLQAILDHTHPEKGVSRFTFGDEHVYGKFK